MSDTVWFSRSELEDWQKCPRKNYYRYHAEGAGIESVEVKLDAEIGTAVHIGIESLLEGREVGIAAAAAEVHIESAIEADRTPPELLTEQRRTDYIQAGYLVEALVRGWAIVRMRRILVDGKVVSIEHEYPVKFPGDAVTVGMQTRPDIVWRRNHDGALFIRNIKTVSEAQDVWRKQWAIDMQTLSEPLGVEAALGEPVSGVLIEGIIKGRRIDYPQGSGKFYHNTPLLYAWMKQGEPPLTQDDWQTRYEWATSEGSKRLGRGYRKVPVWERYPGGVAGWIDHLSIADPELLENTFIELEPILRSEFEIARWKAQTLDQVRDIAWMAREVAEGTLKLDNAFPMHTASGNCLRPGKCAYYELCHGSVGEPLESGLFKIREPHHPVPVED